ncbi:hypothetical protein D3C87_1317000 [compost metagenome]
MINQVSLEHYINESIKLLKELDLYKGMGVKAIGDHSEAFKKISRGNRHTEIYNCAIENIDYEILLFDDSIFQFSLIGDVLRYCFIQNPSIYVDKFDYLKEFYSPEELFEYSDEELLSTIKEEEYEQFVDDQNLNLEANIFRYDLDSKGYTPLLHSYSHIHIGLNENTRISCSKILTPLKFVIFSIKNTYYKEWKNALKSNERLNNSIKQSKDQCSNLPKEFWSNDETFELFIS